MRSPSLGPRSRRRTPSALHCYGPRGYSRHLWFSRIRWRLVPRWKTSRGWLELLLRSSGKASLQRSLRRSRGSNAESFTYAVPQLLLSHRRRDLLEPLQRSIGGRLYRSPTDNPQRQHWYWQLREVASLGALLQRLGPALPLGPLGRRLRLLPPLLQLRSSGAYKPSSPLHSR